MQQTLKSAVSFTGVGLHSGRPVRMTVQPAPVNHGICFVRTDILANNPAANAVIPAIWSVVTPSKLCTVVENKEGASVSTIEHIMAALAGMGIHNALIEIDGPEVPILDGSSEPYVAGFLARGIKQQNGYLRAIRVLKPVEVRDGQAVARLEPNLVDALDIEFRIDFSEAAIGVQERNITLVNGAFVRELSDSRTFCRQIDVDTMQANGLALGGTLENAVVFDGNHVVSPGGLRHEDEPVRHKMLDAVGDLALAGGVILGRYIGNRAGHAMTNRLLRALFADPTAYRIEALTLESDAQLPGFGFARKNPPVQPRVAA